MKTKMGKSGTDVSVDRDKRKVPMPKRCLSMLAVDLREAEICELFNSKLSPKSLAGTGK